MIRLNLLRCLVSLGLAGALVIACGASAASAPAPAISRSSPIAEQVRHNLVTLPWYGVFDNLQYQVNGSEVILSGQLVSEHAVTRSDAEKAVKSIPGVTRVVNHIEVLPPSPFDNQIRRAEYRAIFSRSDLGRYTLGAIPQVRIVVKNGHVSLEGTVMNQMDRTIAGIAANSVPGVFSVENHLQVG